MKKYSITCIKAFILGILLVTYASAQVTVGEVKRLDKRAIKLQRQVANKFSKLSTSDKIALLAARSGKSPDDDSDGLPNNFEGATGLCNSDSDSDGVNDGNEYEHGTDPNNGDSDHDGHGDSDEIKADAEIQAISSISVTLAGQAYVLNGSTEYKDKRNNTVAQSFFNVGDCVELEGHVAGSDKVVDKLKENDDC